MLNNGLDHVPVLLDVQLPITNEFALAKRRVVPYDRSAVVADAGKAAYFAQLLFNMQIIPYQVESSTHVHILDQRAPPPEEGKLLALFNVFDVQSRGTQTTTPPRLQSGPCCL